eukprot:3774201-Prymnesium_polylepis.1
MSSLAPPLDAMFARPNIISRMWLPDLRLSLRARPVCVWRPVQGPIARPPGFLPAPCGGHGPRKAG